LTIWGQRWDVARWSPKQFIYLLYQACL